MRTYGRITNSNGTKTWVLVETSANGDNSLVWLTTLCQCIKLNLGESPFFANYGSPAQPSIVQQVYPDFYVAQLQQQFAQYFASLIISKRSDQPPTYQINVTTLQGVKLNVVIPT